MPTTLTPRGDVTAHRFEERGASRAPLEAGALRDVRGRAPAEKTATLRREASFECDAKCKRAAYGGDVLHEAVPEGSGEASAGGGNDALSLATNEGGPDDRSFAAAGSIRSVRASGRFVDML